MPWRCGRQICELRSWRLRQRRVLPRSHPRSPACRRVMGRHAPRSKRKTRPCRCGGSLEIPWPAEPQCYGGDLRIGGFVVVRLFITFLYELLKLPLKLVQVSGKMCFVVFASELSSKFCGGIMADSVTTAIRIRPQELDKVRLG